MLVMASRHRSDNLPGSVDIMNTLLTWQCLRCTNQWILCIHVDILKIGVSLRCAVEDLDGPKTVEEKLARLAKIRLLKQFSFGVIAYVLATALVVLLPIFVSPEVRHARSTLRPSAGKRCSMRRFGPFCNAAPAGGVCSSWGCLARTFSPVRGMLGQIRWGELVGLPLTTAYSAAVQASAGETAVRIVLILQNVVLWLFMAGLAWIFRCVSLFKLSAPCLGMGTYHIYTVPSKPEASSHDCHTESQSTALPASRLARFSARRSS